MTTTDFTTTIIVNNSAEEVFNAINNVRGWWSEEIEGSTNKLNDEWSYHYQDVHRCKLKVVELIPNKKIVWQVLDNFFSFTKDKSEWSGNKIIFELIAQEEHTQLQFTHLGLVPEYECYDICEGAWTTYVQKSLYSLITTGKGAPNGKDKPQTANEKSMTSDFTTTFFVNQSPQEVFNAINNVEAWWQGAINGNANKQGNEFDYRMLDIHFSKQKVVELLPNKKVVWLVTDSDLSGYHDKKEWTGTKIIFEITAINGKTQLRFSHIGLTPKFECYGACTNAWDKLIKESLFSLITTGKGKDVFE